MLKFDVYKDNVLIGRLFHYKFKQYPLTVEKTGSTNKIIT